MQLEFLKILSGMPNSVDPDQIASEGAIWSGSAVFAHAILLETLLYEIQNIYGLWFQEILLTASMLIGLEITRDWKYTMAIFSGEANTHFILLNMLDKNCSRGHFIFAKIFHIKYVLTFHTEYLLRRSFSWNITFLPTVFMKCQSLFSWKKIGKIFSVIYPYS